LQRTPARIFENPCDSAKKRNPYHLKSAASNTPAKINSGFKNKKPALSGLFIERQLPRTPNLPGGEQ
jgi:hypothetical protein